MPASLTMQIGLMLTLKWNEQYRENQWEYQLTRRLENWKLNMAWCTNIIDEVLYYQKIFTRWVPKQHILVKIFVKPFYILKLEEMTFYDV